MAKILKKTIVCALPVVILAAVTYLSLMPPQEIRTDWWFAKIPYADKMVHFLFYFGVVSASRFSLSYFGHYTKPWKIYLLLLAMSYGGAIELLQGTYFGRGCDIWDETANTLGALVAIWGIPQSWHSWFIRLSGEHSQNRNR